MPAEVDFLAVPEADFVAPEVDLAAEALLPADADLLVPVAFLAVLPEADFLAVPAVLAVVVFVPVAFAVVAFLAPVAADLTAPDFAVVDFAEEVDFLAVPAEADLVAVAAFLVPADLAVADFAEEDLAAVFVVADLPVEAVLFFAVDDDFEAVDLAPPLTALMALLAAPSTAVAALADIFFAALVILFTVPELLLDVVFFVEVAISFRFL